MGCSCNKSYCPECMAGYIPSPPPAVGSAKWKDAMAFRYIMEHGGLPERSCIIQLPADWGYFVVRYRAQSGWDYFRTEEIVQLDTAAPSG